MEISPYSPQKYSRYTDICTDDPLQWHPECAEIESEGYACLRGCVVITIGGEAIAQVPRSIPWPLLGGYWDNSI